MVYFLYRHSVLRAFALFFSLGLSVNAWADARVAGLWQTGAESFLLGHSTQNGADFDIAFGTHDNGLIFAHTTSKRIRGIIVYGDKKRPDPNARFVTFEWIFGDDLQRAAGRMRQGLAIPDSFAQDVQLVRTQGTVDLRSRRLAALYSLRAPSEVRRWMNDVGKDILEIPPDFVLTFDYEMPKRYGFDRNNNDIPDLPNSAAYVHNLGDVPGEQAWCKGNAPQQCINRPPRFSVDLTAGGVDQLPRPIWPLFSWRILDLARGTETTGNGASIQVQLAEDAHKVKLTLGDRRLQRVISVQDHFIANLGDSFGAGEGSPERSHRSGSVFSVREAWADTGQDYPSIEPRFQVTAKTYPDWPKISDEESRFHTLIEHARSHRSSFTHSSQLALDLEDRDPKSSITYVNVAQSGAQIDVGLLERYAGIDYNPDPKDFEDPRRDIPFDRRVPRIGCLPNAPQTETTMCPQVELLRRMNPGGRQIDELFLSIGGNDAGFANVIAALVIAWRSDLFDPDKASTIVPPDRIWSSSGLKNLINNPSEGVFDRLWYDTLEKTENAVQDGGWDWRFWDPGTNFFEFQAGLNTTPDTIGLKGLKDGYSRLDREFQNFWPGNRYVANRVTLIPPPFFGRYIEGGFPDFDGESSSYQIRTDGSEFEGDNALYCYTGVNDPNNTLGNAAAEISPMEMLWAQERVYVPLVEAMRTTERAHGWAVMPLKFQGEGASSPWLITNQHGLCADRPILAYNNNFQHPVQIETSVFADRPGGRERWFNSPDNGAAYQVGNQVTNTGMFHPNPKGFAYSKGILLNMLKAELPNPESPFRDVFNYDTDDAIMEAREFVNLSHNRLWRGDVRLEADWDAQTFAFQMATNQRLDIEVSVAGSALRTNIEADCFAISAHEINGQLLATNSERLRDLHSSDALPLHAQSCDIQQSTRPDGSQASRASLTIPQERTGDCGDGAIGMRQVYVTISRPNNVIYDPVTGRGDTLDQAGYPNEPAKIQAVSTDVCSPSFIRIPAGPATGATLQGFVR